jgi:hypothetical protein
MRVPKLILVAMAIVAVACSSEQSSETMDVAKIGSPISRETAYAMLGINNAAGKQSQPLAYLYGKTTIQQILATPGAAGIVIYNALDKGGSKLVFRPVDASGSVVENSLVWDDGLICPPSCPTNNISSIGSTVDGDKARNWISDFQAANSSRANSFLFGREIVNQVLNQLGVDGIAFMTGSKTSGQEALVLVGIDQSGALLWDGLIVDDGMICPPWCPN